jgi:hypothetical protein
MEFVKNIELKGIQTSHLDTRRDRKDVVYARYSFNGMEIHIVLVVTTSWEQDHLGGGEWERNTEKKP